MELDDEHLEAFINNAPSPTMQYKDLWFRANNELERLKERLGQLENVRALEFANPTWSEDKQAVMLTLTKARYEFMVDAINPWLKQERQAKNWWFRPELATHRKL